MRSLTFIGLVLFSMLTQATVYKWSDKDSKVYYSDKPHQNAEPVELKEKTLNKIALPSIDASDSDKTIEKISYHINITSPEEEATIRDNNGNFEVTATVIPEIKSQYLMVLKLDGQRITSPQPSSTFKLTNIDRGEHTIVVDALTQNGKVFASSPPRKIFLHQATINSTPKKQPKSN